MSYEVKSLRVSKQVINVRTMSISVTNLNIKKKISHLLLPLIRLEMIQIFKNVHLNSES